MVFKIMFVIANKKDNEIIMIGNQLDYMGNGYPRLIEEDTAFPDWMVDVHEVETTPEEVQPGEYCYTKEQGFYLNPNWTEPNKYGVTENTLKQIEEDTLTRLQANVSGVEQTAAMTETMLVKTFRAMTLTAGDQTAARAVNLYPVWAAEKAVEEGERMQCEGKLYRCLKSHVTQESWKPSQDTASIWEVIDVEHAGTAEDPIPFSVNMEVFEGKYYTWGDMLYKCIRNSGQPLQHTPDQLVGIYFEE